MIFRLWPSRKIKPKTEPHIFSCRLLGQIVASGSPPFLNTVSGRLVSIVLNMALMHMGGPSAIVIFGVTMYCGDIVQPLLTGVCDTVQPAIGYNYGAERTDQVKEIEKYALTFVTRWFGFAIQSLFTALDKPVPAMILSLGYACVVPLVLMAVLWNMGLDGLWLNSPLTSLVISIAAGFLIAREQKRDCPNKNEPNCSRRYLI